MNDQDQAAGLRRWANQQRQQQSDSAPAEPVDPAEQTASLLTPAPVAPPVTETRLPPRSKTPLVVVGLPSSGESDISLVRARLGEWSALGRRWAREPDDWDIKIVMAEASDLAHLRNHYMHWALWVDSNADAFAAMYRTLRHLRERGGPNRLLALHEPYLPRQGLLDNLKEAAECYLNMELLVLAR